MTQTTEIAAPTNKDELLVFIRDHQFAGNQKPLQLPGVDLAGVNLAGLNLTAFFCLEQLVKTKTPECRKRADFKRLAARDSIATSPGASEHGQHG